MTEGFRIAIETFISSNHSDKALERGEEYVGEFLNRLITHRQIVGSTKGRYGTYNTCITVEEGGKVNVECDCPSSKLCCHHAIGLALTYLSFPDSFLKIERVADNLKSLQKEDLVKIIYKIISKKPQSFSLIKQAIRSED